MKKQLLMTIGTGLLTVISSSAIAATGETLFKQYCAVCHPDGGNTINPKMTLHQKDLARQGINSREGIVKYMRKPGPGMPAFDAKTISDKDAKTIAEYILKSFK